MPLDARGELAIDIEAVMRQQHDQCGAVLARLLDVGLQIVLADAERPVRNHPARIGDRRVGERLPDHRDLDAAALDHRHRLEGRLVPFGVADILRQERKPELADDLLDALGAERELPVADHGVGLEQRHAVDHVLTLADQRRVAVLPGVAAVEEHHAVAALGADRLEDGGDAIEPAEAAVALGQRREIRPTSARRPRPSRARSCRDRASALPVTCGTSPFASPIAEIDRRLAEQQRHQLGVNVGDMNEGDVADRIETQQLVLRQALLRQGARPAAGHDRRRRGGHLEKIAPREHATLRQIAHARRSSPSALTLTQIERAETTVHRAGCQRAPGTAAPTRFR